jgi:hypothetical protein
MSVNASRRTASPSTARGNALPAPAHRATSAPSPALLAEEASGRDQAACTSDRTSTDLAELNLSFLHVARALSRSSRELAITRLGLDVEACIALERLSVSDLQVLAHSNALIFGLRLDARDLSAHEALDRHERAASDARLLLSAGFA